MISQISKIINHKSKIKNSHAGVTLLLAILILASVLAISFSLATILFIEIRTSGDLLKTEPAYYAATGIAEQSLFNLERNACPGNGANCYTSSFGNSAVLNGTPVVLSTSTPIITEKVKALSIFAITQNKYDFCNVTSGASGCNYGRVTVSYVTTNSGTNPLDVYLCEFDPLFTISPLNYGTQKTYASEPCTSNNPQNGLPQAYWEAPSGSSLSLDSHGFFRLYASNNSSATWNLDPTLQQQLILVNSGTTDIYAKIHTYGPSPYFVDKGLPYVGKTAVDISTTNASVGRKIQVIVPNSSAGSTSNSINYAASANGGVASASSEYNTGMFPAASAINGDRTGLGWGSGTGGWNDNTKDIWDDWLAVAFSSAKSISEVDVFTLPDTYPATPTPTDIFTKNGIVDFEVQYSTNNGGSWTDVPGGSIAGNNLVWRKLTFPTIGSVTNIKVLIHNSLFDFSRIVELEAY